LFLANNTGNTFCSTGNEIHRVLLSIFGSIFFVKNCFLVARNSMYIKCKNIAKSATIRRGKDGLCKKIKRFTQSLYPPMFVDKMFIVCNEHTTKMAQFSIFCFAWMKFKYMGMHFSFFEGCEFARCTLYCINKQIGISKQRRIIGGCGKRGRQRSTAVFRWIITQNKI
jgi:hypothetical protein